jgi:hypothetical protein
MTDREQFEAWSKTVVDPEILSVGPEVALKIWQAARAAPAQPCPYGCTTQAEHDAHYAPAQLAERVLVWRQSQDFKWAEVSKHHADGFGQYAWATIERIE